MSAADDGGADPLATQMATQAATEDGTPAAPGSASNGVEESKDDSSSRSGSSSDSGSGSDSDNDESGSDSGSGGEGSPRKAAAGEDSDDDAGFVKRGRGKKKLKARAARRAAAAGTGEPVAGTKRKREPGAGAGASAGGSKKKKLTDAERIRARYLDLGAEEAGEDEEEEGERLGTRAKSEEVTAARAAYERMRDEDAKMRAKRGKEKTAEEIAAEYEEKIKDSGYLDGDDLDDALQAEARADAAGMFQQAQLPDARDPKLWMLKCKEGAEPEIMISLLNKFAARYEAGEVLGIMSAVCTGKGVIFVESYREAQVKQAVSSINDLYGWKPDAIKLVPIDQMTAVLRVSATRTIFQKNQFVRLTQGVYKGDLAQILDVYEGGARLLVRCIPRINLSLLAVPKEQRKGFKSGASGSRPSQRYFDRDEVMEVTGGSALIETRPKYGGIRCEVFGSATYKDGMLLREVKPVAITAFGPPPTIDEISKFKPRRAKDDEADPVLKSAEDALLDSIASSKTSTFSTGNVSTSKGVDQASNLLPGDAVVVVKGDLIHLSGRVVATSGSTFTMQPTGDTAAQLGLTYRLEMPCDEVIKTFEPADRVKILGGAYIGETGTVVATKHVGSAVGEDLTKAWLAVVLLDSGLKQVEAFVRDLTRTAEVRTSVGDLEGYVLYDLVEVPGVSDQSDAGVIVALGQRDVTVLMTTGYTKTVPVQQLRGKINFRSEQTTAVDATGNQLAAGDVVRVQSAGSSSGDTGTIKHIHKMHVFLHDFRRPKDAGMFVTRSRNCVLAGTKVRAPGTIPASNSQAGGGGFGGGRGGGGMGGGGRGKADPLIGKTVRILSGPQKGRIGIVKSATMTHVTVEQHSYQKTVSLRREAVKEIGDRMGEFAGASGGHVSAYGGPSTYIGGGSTTPFIGGGMTPAVGAYSGAMTPAHGPSATPAYAGAMTPQYGSGAFTPGYPSAMTPMYGAGAGTPMYAGSAQTPAYASQTPMYATGGNTPIAAHLATGGGARTPAMPTAHTYGADEAPWYAPGVYADVVVGAYGGRTGVIRHVQGGGLACQVVFADAPGPGVSIPTTDLRPQLPSSHEFCRFIKGPFAGQVGLVVSVSADTDYVCRVGDDLSDKGDVDIFSADALVKCEPKA